MRGIATNGSSNGLQLSRSPLFDGAAVGFFGFEAAALPANASRLINPILMRFSCCSVNSRCSREGRMSRAEGLPSKCRSEYIRMLEAGGATVS